MAFYLDLLVYSECGSRDLPEIKILKQYINIYTQKKIAALLVVGSTTSTGPKSSISIILQRRICKIIKTEFFIWIIRMTSKKRSFQLLRRCRKNRKIEYFINLQSPISKVIKTHLFLVGGWY